MLAKFFQLLSGVALSSIFFLAFLWAMTGYLSQPVVYIDSSTKEVVKVEVSEEGQVVEKPASWLEAYEGGYDVVYVMPESLRLEEENDR